jgi:hypothetical protein
VISLRYLIALMAALSLLGTFHGMARAQAWQTFIRTREFTALLAEDDAVWGATAEAGLLRWDRALERFDVIRREPGSIADNKLSSLALDRSGRLWVGTRGSGASRRSVDGARWDVVNELDGLPSDSVSVLEAVGDTVWIGTTAGIALWNGREVTGSLPDGITLSFDTTFANPSVTGLVMRGDELWVSTRAGVGMAHVSTLLSDWRPVSQGLAVVDVQELASNGPDIFAHAAGVVYRWRDDLLRWEPEPGAGVVHNLTDTRNVVVAAGESGAFRWVHTATDSSWSPISGAPAAPASAGDDPEITLAPDGRAFAALGEIFYAETGTPGLWTQHPAPDGPPGNNLIQLGLEGPRVYVTTQSQGIGRFDGRTWRHWPPVACSGAECDTTFMHGGQAVGLLVDREGRKWVASWSQALSSFDDSVSPPQFTHHVVATDLDSRKRTWVITATYDSSGGHWFGMDSPLVPDVDPIGLEYYDSTGTYVRNFQSSTSSMSGNFVHGLTVTNNPPNGRLWVGYDGEGLDFVNLPATGDDFHQIDATRGLGVRGLAAFGDSVWLVTATQLWRFSSTATWGSLPVERIAVGGGQAQLGVKPLAVGPDGRVWVGTMAGLRSFGPGAARDSFTIANSPLPHDEVRAVAVDAVTGAVWMTTAGGLARFDPSFTPPAPPPLASLKVRVYPNPSQITGLGLQLRLDGDATSYRGEVYDLAGRRLRRFSVAANKALIWDGRDDTGRLVEPGIYFVRVEAGGRAAVARLALLR